MAEHAVVSKARLDEVIADPTAPHLVPLLKAVRDFQVGWLIVPQNGTPFDVPASARAYTFIATIGDDFDQGLGPEHFHAPSLRRLLRKSHGAVVMASGPVAEVYEEAALSAAVFRSNVVIVETGPEHEIPWIEFIQGTVSGLPILICTTPSGRA